MCGVTRGWAKSHQVSSTWERDGIAFSEDLTVGVFMETGKSMKEPCDENAEAAERSQVMRKLLSCAGITLSAKEGHSRVVFFCSALFV